MKDSTKNIGFVESLRIVSRALRISYKTRGPVSVLISVAGFGMAFVPLLVSMTLRSFTDAAQRLYVEGPGAVGAALRVFAILAALYMLQTLFTSARNYYSAVDTTNVHRYIKERIMRCTCDVKYKYIDNFDDFKERLTLANSFAGVRVANSMQAITAWLQNLITFVSLVAVLLGINAWIVVLLVATCLPAAVLSYLQKDEDYRNQTKYLAEGAFVIRYFHDAVDHFTQNEVRFFGIFNYLKDKWRGTAQTYIGKKSAITRKHVLYNSVADVLRNSTYIAVLLIAARSIFANPSMGLGVFMLVFTVTGQLQEVTTKLFIGAAQFAGDIGYMKDFFALDHLEYEARHKGEEPYESADIRFEDVDFAYPNTTRKVLQGIDLSIRQGEKIAVVGENGSGKTTFVNLLCAMHEPDSGRITVNGEVVSDHVSRVRRTISVVFQDFGKYEASIRENITVSDSTRKATDEQLRELTGRTGVYDFVKDQEHGFDEVVGSFSEEGNNLSGGQWQKIAITRAAFRDDARIMVLDEPTAALDPIAEADLYRNFAKLTGDRTTILVSHRLGITRIVDRVLVFDDGRVVEDGTHEELMDRNGLYAKMYRAQAQWYSHGPVLAVDAGHRDVG